MGWRSGSLSSPPSSLEPPFLLGAEGGGPRPMGSLGGSRPTLQARAVEWSRPSKPRPADAPEASTSEWEMDRSAPAPPTSNSIASATTSTTTTTTTLQNVTEARDASADAIPARVIFVGGGSFQVLGSSGSRESFADTTPEYIAPHLIFCPTPDPSSWRRPGGGRTALRVTANGMEWSPPLSLSFRRAPAVSSVVAIGSLPVADGPPTATWGRSSGEAALLLRGSSFGAWPDMLCEMRGAERTAFAPALVLSDAQRTCAIPPALGHERPEDLRVQLLAPHALPAHVWEGHGALWSPSQEGSGGWARDLRPQVLGLSPDWGWSTGGTLLQIHGANLPAELTDQRREPAVHCDFGVAGVVAAATTSPSLVECVAPAISDAAEVGVSVLLGSPVQARLSAAEARFRYIRRFHLAQISPVLGSASGGTNVTLTLTTEKLPMSAFELDCAFGHNRVRASLVQVVAVAVGARSYSIRCEAPPAINVPRLTEEGCTCRRRWFLPNGAQWRSSCAQV